jgi:hypothetical protein
MNKHIYTNPKTFYPIKYIYNWIHGENVRLIRNCDKRSSYDRHVNDFIEFLKRRDYPLTRINKQISKTNFDDKESWMKKKTKEDNKNNYIIIENDENRNIITDNTRDVLETYNKIYDSDFKVALVTKKGESLFDALSKVRKNI